MHPQLALALATLLLAVAIARPVKLVLVSDIHYDPLYNTPNAYGKCTDGSFSTTFGHPGCDAPLELVTSAINDAIAPARGADYMLMTGDWVRHDMGAVPYEMIPAFSTVAKLVSGFHGHVVPLPNFAGALGNNDFVPDYHFNLSTPAHPLLHNLTEVLRNHSVMTEAEAPTFAKCGYYRRDVPNTTLTLVVMNTLIWSTYLNPPLSADNTDPCGQMAWLNSTLSDVRQHGRRAYLLSHIPPTVNLYSVLVAGGADSNSGFWFERFKVGYKALLSSFQDVIAVQFFGHTHQFSFLADLEMGVPLFIIPSVTPVFGNNPSYFVAEADSDTWAITAIRQRYLDASGAWVEGQSLGSVLNPSAPAEMGLAAMQNAAKQLQVNDTMWVDYERIHAGGIPKQVWPSHCATSNGTLPVCRNLVACSMRHSLGESVEACLKRTL